MKWTHYNEHGEVIGEIHRLKRDSGKVDIPHYRASAFGWGSGIPDEKKPLPPFGLESIYDYSSPIIIAEGQKCATQWKELGYQCLSGVCGSSYVKRMDWSCLAKAREIWLSPDNDTPGWKYINDVALEIRKHNHLITFKLIALPHLPPKGDICDYVQHHDINSITPPNLPITIPYKPKIEAILPPPTPKKTSFPGANMDLSRGRGRLLDMASQHTDLLRFSGGWKGKCPFHDDRHDSFTITRNELYWKCWAGCGEGSVYDFIMKLKGVGFPEAVEQVRENRI